MINPKELTWLIRDKYAGDKRARGLVGDRKRLQAGEPVDYVIGWKEFLGCKIDLSKKPLIPREETEYWMTQVMKGELRLGATKILDLFAGSGCIGVALLKFLPHTQVVFGEKEKKLLAQIKINCKTNGIKESRYKIIETDIFSKIKGKFDYIFANPPYIAKHPLRQLADGGSPKTQKSVTDWEPAAALWGGPDGLLYIDKFLQEAKKYLNKDGKIFLEFDHKQKGKIEKFLVKYKYESFTFYRDQFERWRWVVIS